MLDDEAEGTYAAREALTEGDHPRAPGEPSCRVGVGPARRVQADAGAPAGPPRQRHGAGRRARPARVTAFLAALGEVPLMDRLPMRLRQRTERQVFAFLRKEREQRHPGIDVEALEDLDPDALAPRRARTDEELYDLALLIQRAVQEGVSTSGLDVVEATVLRRELLRAYVERLEPDDDVARERLYQRLKRQRSRAMQRLKSLLTTTSPIQLSIGF
jgi:hypothetical protein